MAEVKQLKISSNSALMSSVANTPLSMLRTSDAPQQNQQQNQQQKQQQTDSTLTQAPSGATGFVTAGPTLADLLAEAAKGDGAAVASSSFEFNFEIISNHHLFINFLFTFFATVQKSHLPQREFWYLSFLFLFLFFFFFFFFFFSLSFSNLFFIGRS